MTTLKISVSVSILDRSWVFQGFDAIRELAEWLEDHASYSYGGGGPEQPDLGGSPTPMVGPPP